MRFKFWMRCNNRVNILTLKTMLNSPSETPLTQNS